ncbi:MAG: xanthine dehydrogenase family protein molybdopterin-binding subunit [Sphingomonadaceae bacterium]
MVEVKKTQVEFEGQVIEETAVIQGPQPEPWPEGEPLEVVGSPAPRVDGFERVTGKARFTTDVRPPGMLYGRILRSPFPHARIASIDTTRAELLSGVRAVLSPANAPAIRWKDGKLLLDTVVGYVGDEVAAVAADDPETASDAIDLINVEYEELPFVLDPHEALTAGAPKVHPAGNLMGGKPSVYERGDMQRGWAEAEVTIEETFHTQAALHNSLEPHGSVAHWVGDELTIWDSTQAIFQVRTEIAEILALPLHRVRVISEYVGGGFGSKQESGKYTILAALLSRMSGRPVQLMLTRHEENHVTGHRHATEQRIRLGAKRDGTLTAIDLHCLLPVGYYGYPSSVDGPARVLYACPNVHTELYAVRTNEGPARAFRAPGYTEGTFALESAMDMLADRLSMDPLELRLKNYAEKEPTSGADYSSKRLREAYQLAAERFGWASRNPLAAQAAPLASRRRGMGMASQIWGGGGGPPAYAVIKLNPDGTAVVVVGIQDIGTGTRTGLAQVAAEVLGLPLESVSVSVGDTRDAPYGPTSGGSQTLSSAGPAVRSAAEDVRAQLMDIASEVMQTPRERLDVKGGFIFDTGSPDTRRPVGELLSSFGNLMLVGAGSRGPNPPGHPIRTFGAQFAEVEVDTETGRVRVLRVVSIHDIGRVVNPMLVNSQLVGGITQGLGYAITEGRVVDARTGRVLNPDLEEYLIPTSMDMPEIDASALDQPDLRSNNLGAKGVGEPPIIPTAPAVANAVFNATGVRVTSLPIAVEKVIQKRMAP